MPSVLTAAAALDCGHGGAIAPKNDPQVRLSVSRSPALTAEALINQTVSTCGTAPTGPPPPGTPVSIKCLKCTGISSAQSTKLTVHGVAVLLAPLGGSTDGTVANVKPQVTLKATGVQTKLTAV
jgi:hypothetical protein